MVYLTRDRDITKGLHGLLEGMGYCPSSDRAVIKPNIVVPAGPGSGVVTDPLLVRALIRWLKGRGVSDITIAESPALFSTTGECFEKSGYRRMAEEEGVTLLDLNTAPRREVEWEFGTIKLPDIMFDRAYINVAKLKTHVQTTVSLGAKNQKGILLPRDKKKFHKLGLHGPIAALARVVKPELTIVDGVVAMEGDGPIFGRKRKSGLIIGGTDMLEVDLACLDIMGIPLGEVEHLRLLAGDAPEAPVISGDAGQGKPEPFEMPNRDSKRLMNLVSWRTPDACTMCTYNTDLALKKVAGNPRYLFKALRLAWRAVFGGVNFIYGRNRGISGIKGKVILIGDCARVPYEGLDATSIPGCPPEVDDIVDKL